MVYEPVIKEDNFFNSKVIKKLEEFKNISDLIVANRLSENIMDVKSKIFTSKRYF